MPVFGKNSKEYFSQLHQDLQKICEVAINRIDFAITCGYRNKSDQDKAKAEGNSNAAYGQSPHNFKPAMAFDFIPCENGKLVEWKDYDAFQKVVNVLNAVSRELRIDIRTKIVLRWNVVNGEKVPVIDWPHVELLNWKKRQ